MKNNYKIVWLICFFLIINLNLQAQSDSYAQVSIHLTADVDLALLQEMNLEIDHVHPGKNNTVSIFVTHEEFTVLNNEGIRYDIIIPDYREYYNRLRLKDLDEIENQSESRSPASHFDYGSMGGFYTLSEIEGKLDEMHTDFPNLTTEKFSIGTSIEGRTIWAMKISDNAGVDENEPVVYYDALHHAREPLSMAVSINFMFWLLENYAGNPQARYVVDNRELFFVPCVNPDGYEYNRQTDPNGGGLWRKNRRDNGDGCFGVDLNRNYSFEFGHDGSCASSNTCSNTYKGPNYFSEPETIATSNFIDSINPRTAFSIHSTAGSYLMPYGYNTSPPQFDIYSEWASEFLSINDYPYGVTYQMLGYTSCGTTRDYLHSEGIYGWTPEIDGSGFWPLQSEIFDLVDENVYPLFYQAWIAGDFTDFQSHEIFGDALVDSSFQMQVEVKNIGVGDTSTNVEVILVSVDSNITITGDGTIGSLAPRTRALTSNFTVEIGSEYTGGSVEIICLVYQDSVETDHERILVPIGTTSVLFSDNAEAGDSNWLATGNGISWGLILDDSYDGIYSFGDSDDGNSQNNTLNYFTLASPLNLDSTLSPKLEFYSKWSLDAGDFIELQASIDGGSFWTSIKSFTACEPWHQELINLDNFKYSNFKIRFLMDTDGSIPGDGFYFDKLTIKDYDCMDCPICISSISEFPYFESFESGFGDWTQGSDDDLDWTRDANGTPSDNTGPDTAADGSYYLYLEASTPNYPDKTASLVSPCFNFTEIGQAILYFQYHMYGTADSMKLMVQTSIDAGSTWSSAIWSRTGNQGNQWLSDTLDLSDLNGEYVMVRFYGQTGETWQGDIAIDAISMNACPQTLFVDDNPIADGIYMASDTVLSDKTILTGGQVTFRAGESVYLNPNFEVDTGAIFEVEIKDCFD